MGWTILDAHDVDTGRIEEFAAANAPQVALMAEYIDHLAYSPHLRDYLLCVLSREGARLVGLCWIGGNIVPVGVPAAAMGALVKEIRRRGRRYSSIVGPRHTVEEMWDHVGGLFGRPREFRWDQPHLEITAPPDVPADPHVRPTAREDFDILLPAAVAMFTEEVGYSPLSSGGGYERRVRSLISERRSLSRIEMGGAGREVIFKADLGTIGYGLTQVQGVWVHPDHRGRGLAAPAMAAVVDYAHEHVAPVVSLYVNHFNAPALAAYRRVGFTQTDTFSTILY